MNGIKKGCSRYSNEARPKIESKKIAEKQYEDIQSLIDKEKKNVQAAEQEQQTAQQQVEELSQTLNDLKTCIENDTRFLRDEPDSTEIQKEWDENQQVIQRLQK